MAERRRWIEPGFAGLSVRQQCSLLGLYRSNLYYEAVTENPEDLRLMRLIDEEYLGHPFLGSRRIGLWLEKQGERINRKKTQRLMQKVGLQGIAPGPRTTRRETSHKVYPHLLRGMEIARPNQVWACDITYVPLAGGYLYLAAVMDWYSRCVLGWQLSNSMDVEFCLEALEEAFQHVRPEIFNTDQGSQFTSRPFTGRLGQEEIAISMDCKGRAIDNVMIERLWRTVKYEHLYLKEYRSGADCHKGLKECFNYYCHERPHQALANQTPWQVFKPTRRRSPRAPSWRPAPVVQKTAATSGSLRRWIGNSTR